MANSWFTKSLYISPGTYYFSVLDGITSICIICVGGGGGGGASKFSDTTGGGGGGGSSDDSEESGGNGGGGGVRIIWGSGRSYPSNASDVYL